MVWHFRKKLLASRFPFESGAGYIWSGRDTVFDKIYGTFCFWKREPAKEAISTHLAVSSIKSSIFQNSLAYGTVLDINSNLSPLFPFVCLKPDFSVIFVKKIKTKFFDMKIAIGQRKTMLGFFLSDQEKAPYVICCWLTIVSPHEP